MTAYSAQQQGLMAQRALARNDRFNDHNVEVPSGDAIAAPQGVTVYYAGSELGAGIAFGLTPQATAHYLEPLQGHIVKSSLFRSNSWGRLRDARQALRQEFAQGSMHIMPAVAEAEVDAKPIAAPEIRLIKYYFDLLGINNESAARILDCENTRHAHWVLEGYRSIKGKDQQHRIAHIVSIFASLDRIMNSNRDSILTYLNFRFPQLNERTPMELLAGDLVSVVALRHFIERQHRR